jgi:hypothetical protein
MIAAALFNLANTTCPTILKVELVRRSNFLKVGSAISGCDSTRMIKCFSGEKGNLN